MEEWNDPGVDLLDVVGVEKDPAFAIIEAEARRGDGGYQWG